MPCYHPIKGYYSKHVNRESGKRSVVFSEQEAHDDTIVHVNCGQCIGCRLERSRQWAIRCVHESQLYEQNCFITLTYDEEHLPWAISDDETYNPTLQLEDFQNFMKRLRKSTDKKIKFFHAGEYGEKLGRPHYHAIIFNYDVSDRELYTIRNGVRLYTSKQLQKLWPFGFSSVGDVTFESVAYVARYILKKQTGPESEAHYRGRRPEYTTMSRREGIGSKWLEKYKNDVFQQGMDARVVLGGKILNVPKFYEEKLKHIDFEHYDEIKLEKSKNSVEKEFENSYDRRKARETLKIAQVKQLKRELK